MRLRHVYDMISKLERSSTSYVTEYMFYFLNLSHSDLQNELLHLIPNLLSTGPLNNDRRGQKIIVLCMKSDILTSGPVYSVVCLYTNSRK